MKNLTKLLIAAVFMLGCCFISCNKQKNIVTPTSDDSGTLTSKSLHCGRVFSVSPSGNYNDDSYNIQTTLNNAVAAGPGSTVQLTKGTFYLKYRIEVEGFDGYFKGAGKDKTIITTHETVDFSDVLGTDAASLIKFRHGNINISDMTISISDPAPCNLDEYGNAFPCIIRITGNSSENPGGTDQAASATFNNVKFVGGVGSFNNYNVGYFLLISWDGWYTPYPLNGAFKITNCEFKSAHTCIWTDFTNGPCIIGGAESSGNKFEDINDAVGTHDINNSYSNISYNHFTKIYENPIWCWQQMYSSNLSMSKFLVHDNDMEIVSRNNELPYEVGIELGDFGILTGATTETKMDINLSNNKIYLNNISFVGISGVCCSNVVVTNNKIWGNALAGITFGISEQPASGWFLKGNNVKGVNAQVAPIWLGPVSSNCLVYADKNDVLDEGTNNIVIGDHKKRSGHPGPEIRDKMMRQHDMIKLQMHPGMK